MAGVTVEPDTPALGRTAPAGPGEGPGARAASCPHCGTAVEGTNDAFCCTGCEHAWEIIHGAGLQDYYRRRDALPPRPSGDATGWSSVPVETDPDGICHLALQVDGLRCAACVWVTERVLGSMDGVSEAHVSYATGRTRLSWDPDAVGLEDLAATIAALGYRPRVVGEGERWDRGLLLRLGFAAFAAMNIMLLSASIYAGWASSMDARYVALFTWTSLVLATPLTFWAAAPFFEGAVRGLRSGVLHMDLPIALAVAVLYGHGFVVTVTASGDAYFDSLGMLVTLLLAGRVLESHGRRRTAEAALSLAAVAPADARRLRADGSVETVPSADLVAGDRITVGPGQEFPADGVVLDGHGRVASALLTGESRATPVGRGGEVYAGTLLQDGALTVEVRAAGADTVLHGMAARLRDAVDKPPTEILADRLAPAFTAVTLLVAAATAVGWWLSAGVEPALRATIAVLVVACPCALALARPLVASAGLGALARRGLLVRGPDVLDRLGEVDRLAFDKTGTVTLGVPTVLDPDPALLRIAAGLERWSSHPIARAILDAAVARGIPLPNAEEVVEVPGRGVEGTLDGVRYRLRSGGDGRVRVERAGAGPGPEPAWDTVGALRLEDRARDDSGDVVRALEAEGLTVTLLTGDDPATARRVADQVAVREVEARMSPEEKTRWIEDETGAGRRVLFAGDGLNDGPALAAAHVGIAMGTGATSSVIAADGVVATESIRPVLLGLRIARHSAVAVRRAQLRSIVYNVVAVSAAAAGWVNPLVAAVLMPLSSSLVLHSAAGVERFARRVDRSGEV